MKHQRVRIRGLVILVFRKIAYLLQMNDPLMGLIQRSNFITFVVLKDTRYQETLLLVIICIFFLSGFSLTNIHDSQDWREGGGCLFNPLLPFPPASQTLRD